MRRKKQKKWRGCLRKSRLVPKNRLDKCHNICLHCNGGYIRVCNIAWSLQVNSVHFSLDTFVDHGNFDLKPKQTASISKLSVSVLLTVLLSVFCWLSVCLSGGENVPRARGLCMWGLWRPAKKHCLSSCFIRTRPLHHSQGQRCTHRIVEQRKGQSDAQILIVKTNELRREKNLQYMEALWQYIF